MSDNETTALEPSNIPMVKYKPSKPVKVMLALSIIFLAIHFISCILMFLNVLEGFLPVVGLLILISVTFILTIFIYIDTRKFHYTYNRHLIRKYSKYDYMAIGLVGGLAIGFIWGKLLS